MPIGTITVYRTGKECELFDFEKDPAEVSNLWDEPWASVDQSVINTLSKAGGFRQNRTDAPILEMALDRLADDAGVSLLLYSYPVRLIFAGETAFWAVVGNKSGEQIIKAKVIVDATESVISARRRRDGNKCSNG